MAPPYAFAILPVDNFFQEFLPVGDEGPPTTSPGFTAMANATSEKEMHGFFINATSSLLTNFTAFDASNIPCAEADSVNYPSVTIHERKKGPPTSSLAAFQTMEMFVEFKHGDSTDPYTLVDVPPRTPPESAYSTLTRIHSNLSRQHALQFRTWTFAVGVFGKVARILRCDRSGILLTTAIDYSTEEGNRQLTEFFLRLDRMADGPEARGWDPTVDDATEEEADRLSELIKAFGQSTPDLGRRVTRLQKKKAAGEPGLHPAFRNLVGTVGDLTQFPRKKMSVMDGDVSKHYIIGCHSIVSKGLAGRATRGFVAMSMETKGLVFLKETWRADVAGVPPEHYWYERLLSNRSNGGMENIGTYSHGSDVYATKRIVRCSDTKQRTISHLYTNQPPQTNAIRYVRYRIVYSELYVSLLTFRDSKHLSSVMLDIAQALEYTHKAGVFHCDLSPGNIMIDIHGHGHLIDFDIARPTDTEKQVGGTLRFMSTLRLILSDKRYEVPDELESFFIVFLYLGLHFIVHNKPFKLNVKEIFDDARVEPNGRKTYGMGRLRMYLVDADVMLRQLQFEKSPPFTHLIRNLFKLFQSLAMVGVCRNNGRQPSPHDVANVNSLRDCQAVIRMIKEAMSSTDWPEECDKVEAGNYTRVGVVEDRRGPQAVKIHVPAPVPPFPTPTGERRVPKRGREEDHDGHKAGAKSSKVQR